MGGFDEVLAAAREGEGWALTQLYRAVYPRFVRYASAVAPGDAHDVAADAWLDIARSLDRFRGDEAAFRAWAFTIARRRLLEEIGRASCRERVSVVV